MKPEETFRRIDSNFTLTCVTAHLEGLEIRVEYKEYKDFPMTEWVAYFENVSDKNSKNSFRHTHRRRRSQNRRRSACLFNGDDLSVQGYSFLKTTFRKNSFSAPTKAELPVRGGSYMRLRGREGGFNIAVGWSGQWIAEFEKTNDGVNVAFGQKRCNLYLKPGEVFRTPRVNIESYVGDEDHARNMWRRFYIKHILPKDRDGSPLHPKLCLHLLPRAVNRVFPAPPSRVSLRLCTPISTKAFVPTYGGLTPAGIPATIIGTTPAHGRQIRQLAERH